jgi:hypothetical protein
MLCKILEPNAPVDADRISSFEERHEISLPKAYRDFLLRHNGGQPEPAAFPIEGMPDNPYGGVQAFFGLDANLLTEDLDLVLADLAGLIPAGILPIACTDGDDFVCLDLRRLTGPVVYWDRVPFWGENVWDERDLYPVADDFGTFLNELYDDA